MPREQQVVLALFGGSLTIGLVLMLIGVVVQAVGITNPVRRSIHPEAW
jgi:hypothetical protein